MCRGSLWFCLLKCWGLREKELTQVVAFEKLKRLVALSKKINVAVGLDSIEGARRLSETAASAGAEVDYLIEINSGLNRCGVAPGRETIELVRAALPRYQTKMPAPYQRTPARFRLP